MSTTIFSRPWLQTQGLNDAPLSDTPQVIGADGNAGNVNLTKGGTYDIYTNNHKAGDTVDIGNQHDIFARLGTDKDDKVKLEGTGWTKIDDPNNNVPGGHEVYINKNTNSAVIVDGGAAVTDDQGNTIPTQLQPARVTARRLLEPKTNPADAALILTTNGNYEKVAGGSATDHKISLGKRRSTF